MFINNPDEGIKCTLSKCVDNTKMRGLAVLPQWDLDRMES